jgi:PPOX class probable F420-dependent enzyme
LTRLRGTDVLRDPLVRELLASRLVGVLATLDVDGGVHAVAVWLAEHEGAIVVATNAESRKVKNLERDPRATLALHDSRPGLEVCGASIRGRARVVRRHDAAPLVELVHRRYVSENGLALTAVGEFLQGDDVALVLEVEAATTWDERGSPADLELRASGEALPLVETGPRTSMAAGDSG